MTNCKKLSLGLVAATMMLATPAMAQVVYQEPGVMGYYPNSAYATGGYGVRAAPGPGFRKALKSSDPCQSANPDQHRFVPVP